MTDELTPERAVRLLRAKASELEQQVKWGDVRGTDDLQALVADVALVASLLADGLDRWHATTTWLAERVADLEQILIDYEILDPGIDPPVVDVPGPDTYEPAQ